MTSQKVLMLFISMGTIFLAGCVSPLSFHGRIVERSKMNRPTWLDLAPGQLHESKGIYSMVSIKDYVHDVPLGVHQAVDLAISRFVELVALRSVGEHPELSQKPNNLPQNGAIKKELLTNAISKLNRDMFRVVDIYFESYDVSKYTEDAIQREYSSIYVLVYCPKEELEKIVKGTVDEVRH